MLDTSPPETPTPSSPNNLPRFAANLAQRGKYGYQSYRKWKRLIDILASAVALVIFGPLMLVIAVLIASKDGFPVIFKQRRIGEGGRIFHMYKFRSMVKNAEEVLRKDPALWAEFQKNFKLDPDPRITKVGGFIRKTSLDELPQFWNVLKGDMSVVGPRPIVEKELSMYGDRQELYLRMKPGCAGLWQCSGRSETSYEERIELDEQYYRTASVRNDIKILVMTLLSIVKREGAK